jgi:hypothetical protein
MGGMSAPLTTLSESTLANNEISFCSNQLPEMARIVLCNRCTFRRQDGRKQQRIEVNESTISGRGRDGIVGKLGDGWRHRMPGQPHFTQPIDAHDEREHHGYVLGLRLHAERNWQS